MKLLKGQDLASDIKQRQAKEVLSLRQTHNLTPKLAIIQTKDDPVINTYVRLKKEYGSDIGISVDSYFVNQDELRELLERLNADSSVNGVIVQLPLADTTQTDEIINLVAPEKDVDGLGQKARFQPATPMAILWLLAHHGISLEGKKILIVGRGKLVGAPLEWLLKNSGVNVSVANRTTPDLKQLAQDADIVVTAAGSPGIITPQMLKTGAVIIDAGVASEDGKTVGDVATEVYERDDLIITPAKGGVGPLTVCALFENVLRAAKSGD